MLDRQWHILTIMPRFPRTITPGEILSQLVSEGYEVDPRTIQRDLQFLSTKFPFFSDEREKPYHWCWSKDSPILSLPGLSNSEALTFTLVQQHLKPILPASILEQLNPFFKAASEKLETLSGPIHSWLDKVRAIPPSQRLLKPIIDADIHLKLSEALLFDKQVKVTYQRSGEDRAREYTIHPLALVERQPTIYLVCTCNSEDGFKNWPLQRFKSAYILEEPCERPDDFNIDQHLESSKGLGFGGNGENIHLEAIFEKFSGNHLYDTPLSLDQTISELDDNHLKITATVSNTEQLRWWLLGFGERIEIIGPPELREMMAKTANEMYQIYSKT